MDFIYIVLFGALEALYKTLVEANYSCSHSCPGVD